jgi:hypothetical protein
MSKLKLDDDKNEELLSRLNKVIGLKDIINMGIILQWREGDIERYVSHQKKVHPDIIVFGVQCVWCKEQFEEICYIIASTDIKFFVTTDLLIPDLSDNILEMFVIADWKKGYEI